MKLSDLSSLDFNNIGSWPWPVKAVVILLVCAATQFAGYKLLLESQQADLEAAIQKEDSLRSELEAKAHKVVHLAQYKDKLRRMNESFGAMLRQLPDKNEVAELLVDISQSGLASGLEFELFKPRPEVKKGFYAELPIQIKVTGNYHEFGRFISEVAGLSRIVTVHDFNIKGIGKGDNGELVMESTAKTYRYLDEDEVASAKRKKRKKGKKGKKS